MAETQPLSEKAKRKLRRRAENDFYAQDARFWIGRIKSAERMGYDQAVNRGAREEVSSKVEPIDLRSTTTKHLYRRP